MTQRRVAMLVQTKPKEALVKKTMLVWFLSLTTALAGCGIIPANVPDGCYRFDDGTPLFKVAGNQGYLLSKGAVNHFRIGSWHELARKSVEIRPAFYLPGLPASDPRRGETMPIPSIPYSRFAFDPQRNVFSVPIAAWGEEEVKLGRPC